MSRSRLSVEREAYWSEWVTKWQTCGGTKKAFCEEHGLPLYSFYDWARRLAPPNSPGTGFAQVSCAGSGLRLRIGPHAVLEVDPEFDGATLRRILTIIGSATC